MRKRSSRPLSEQAGPAIVDPARDGTSPHRGSLTRRTEQALRSRISNGPMQVGERLPTENALALEFGVSRTVVREAVAALRADGLLEARHGVGVFVTLKPAKDVGARIADDLSLGVAQTRSFLDVLEIRMAVEMHSAALAALRRSWAQEAKIMAAHEQMRIAIDEEAPSEQADFAFHRAIAEATNNPTFVEFLDRLGCQSIPRSALSRESGSALISRSYLDKVQAEHLRISEAVSAGDAAAAHEAMKVHLQTSQHRYRGLVQAGKGR